MSIPAATGPEGQVVQMDMVARAKELLSEPSQRILLHDFVVQELKKVINLTTDGSFAVQDQPFSEGEFAERLARYEEITRDLRRIAASVAYWGKDVHRNVLALMHSRIVDHFESENGLVAWLTLRWYPLILTLYSTGVAALAAKKYANLAAVFLTNVDDPNRSQGRIPLVHALGKALLEMNRVDGFKTLPGHERNFVPRSEYLFKLLEPELDDLLYLGRDYEECFDQFEVFLALVCGYFHMRTYVHFRAPMGRFSWKAREGHGHDPFKLIRLEAEAQRSEWQPIRTGLFPAGYDQFEETANELAQVVSHLQWY